MTPAPGPAITSAANPRLKALAQLRDRRGRDRTGQLLIDGARELVQALDGGVRIVEAFVAEPMPPDVELAAAAGRLLAAGVPITTVAPDAMGRIAYGDRAGGMVAVAIAPTTDLDSLAERLAGGGGFLAGGTGRSLATGGGHPALIAVVEDVEKPGNLGAVCRSADGAGFDALIAASGAIGGADPWNPNAIRASVGTVFTLPVATASAADVLAFLRASGIAVFAARVDGTDSYTDVDFTGPCALVLGSEAYGLTPTWHVPGVIGVRLPMLGRADSLNVSAAAAILFYEARRQRGGTAG